MERSKRKTKLEVDQLYKSFGKNLVLKDISMKIKEGEVHGIVGANGSGKSTFLNILSGDPVIKVTGGYEGNILVNHKKINIDNSLQAKKCGISMVHQELTVFNNFTVAENINVSREIVEGENNLLSNFLVIDRKMYRKRAQELLESLKLDIDLASRTGVFSIAIKQFIEILREINANTEILLLDEPTSSLNEVESKKLIEYIKQLAKTGISILFVTHKMEEIMEACDRVSVFRDGVIINSYDRSEFDYRQIADDMIGREIEKARLLRTKTEESDADKKRETILEYKNFKVQDQYAETSLQVKRGEMLGITGLAGQGQENFAQAMMKLIPYKGKILYLGEEMTGNVHQIVDVHNIYYLSGDRRNTSLILTSPVWENMFFGSIDNNKEFVKFPKLKYFSFLNKKNIYDKAEKYIKELNIVTSGPEQLVIELSGGNQQKVCIARIMAIKPDVLFISDPTRGIDIYSKEVILNLLLKLNEEGTTIIVNSGETEELVRICDRIAVVNGNEVIKVFEPEYDLKKIALAIYGEKDEEIKTL